MFRKRRADSDFAEEIRSHLELEADEFEAEGMPRDEAERNARVGFGNVTAARERFHLRHRWVWSTGLLQDLHFATRKLKKSPGFAVVAIITLALGIGTNAVVFSVLNALVLKPVNVPDAQSLYMVQRVIGGQASPGQSYPDYLDLRDRNRGFESLASYDIIGAVGLDTGGGNASAVWPYLVSGNYFDVLGVRPYLGRFFGPSDEHGENSVPYIVLSYDYWKGQFQGDPAAVGRTVQVNRHPYTILGVAPPGFRGTELFFAPAFFAPVLDVPQIADWDPIAQRGWPFTWIIGHLKPGVTPTQATMDLNALAASLARSYPKDDEGLKFVLARPGLVGNTLGRPARAFMLALTLLAALILLAACTNLGSLFAAGAADRSREIAVRTALGSGRWRVMRQLLTETLVVALLGGALGLCGGIALMRLLGAWHPIPGIPINLPVSPNAETFALALLLSVCSGVFFGMVTVRQVLRTDPWQTIRSGGAAFGGLRRFTVRDVLLAVQIALCAVLVTASLVAVRGLERSLHSNFGFQPENTILAEADLHMGGYGGDPGLMEERMLTGASQIPGVNAVGYTDRLPLSVSGNNSAVYRDSSTDFRPTKSVAESQQFDISPDYFRAAGTTLLAGRTLTLHDDSKAPMVAVVNQEFARRLFGSVEKAIGGHFKIWQGTRVQVVGVVENGKYTSLTEDNQPAMFFSFLQQSSGNVWLVVSSQRDPREIAGALRQTLRGIDPGLPVRIERWEQELSWVLFPARIATIALGVLGLIGSLLAVTGIFGMASYAVSKRLRELGLRVALGANQPQVLKAALGRAFRLLAIGSGAGIVLGVLASQVMAHIVYQATSKDPLVLGGVVLTMLLLGLLATWIPAQRALGVDPMILLREE